MTKSKKKENVEHQPKGPLFIFHFGQTQKNLAKKIEELLRKKGFTTLGIKMETYADPKASLYAYWKRGGKDRKAYSAANKGVVKKELRMVAYNDAFNTNDEVLRELKKDADTAGLKYSSGAAIKRVPGPVTLGEIPLDRQRPGIHYFFKKRNPLVVVYHFPKKKEFQKEDQQFKEALKKNGWKIVRDDYSKIDRCNVLFVGKMVTLEEDFASAKELKELVAKTKTNYKRFRGVYASRFAAQLRKP